MKKISLILLLLFVGSAIFFFFSPQKQDTWKVDKMAYTENASCQNLLLGALLGEQIQPQKIQLNGEKITFVYSNNETFETSITGKKMDNNTLVLQTTNGEISVKYGYKNTFILAMNNTYFEMHKMV